ncbi:hypothetical protein GCM10027174_36420 [Salinifilum aidingensis]
MTGAAVRRFGGQIVRKHSALRRIGSWKPSPIMIVRILSEASDRANLCAVLFF